MARPIGQRLSRVATELNRFELLVLDQDLGRIAVPPGRPVGTACSNAG